MGVHDVVTLKLLGYTFVTITAHAMDLQKEIQSPIEVSPPHR